MPDFLVLRTSADRASGRPAWIMLCATLKTAPPSPKPNVLPCLPASPQRHPKLLPGTIALRQFGIAGRVNAFDPARQLAGEVCTACQATRKQPSMNRPLPAHPGHAPGPGRDPMLRRRPRPAEQASATSHRYACAVGHPDQAFGAAGFERGTGEPARGGETVLAVHDQRRRR